MKFKIGDRVAFYENCGRSVATVKRADGSTENIFIEGYSQGIQYREWVHPKQCRRLKPKRKAREFWMVIGSESGKVFKIDQCVGPAGDPPMMLPPCSNQDLPRWTLVREVIFKGNR